MRKVVLVALVAVLFGGAGYVGANFEKSWLTWGTPERNPDPYIQYLQHLGLGTTGGGFGGNYKRATFDQYWRLYRLEQTFAPATGTKPGNFGDYLQTVEPGNPKVLRTRAGEILTALFALTPKERLKKKLTFAFSAEGKTAAGDIALEDQQLLLRLALIPYWGGVGAENLAGNLGTLQQQFTLEKYNAGRQNEAGGFLDYLSQKYNLGRYFSTPVQQKERTFEDLEREWDERERQRLAPAGSR